MTALECRRRFLTILVESSTASRYLGLAKQLSSGRLPASPFDAGWHCPERKIVPRVGIHLSRLRGRQPPRQETTKCLPLHGVHKIRVGSLIPKREVDMEREAVSSSNLVSVGYNPDSETLEVEFKNSGIYEYYNVPQFMYDRLMQAGSIGTFFNTEIKTSYACSKVWTQWLAGCDSILT
jgi:hypothetical protein